MVHMRRLEHNGVHGTKKGAMHPDPVSDDHGALFILVSLISSHRLVSSHRLAVLSRLVLSRRLVWEPK